jgi:hypothetical protein
MKIAIELYAALTIAFNLTFMVLGLFPTLARHPVYLVRRLTQVSLINVYQMRNMRHTKTVWFNLMQVAFVILWAICCGLAFAHGWTFVGVSLVIALVYVLYSEALIAFKPIDQYCY